MVLPKLSEVDAGIERAAIYGTYLMQKTHTQNKYSADISFGGRKFCRLHTACSPPAMGALLKVQSTVTCALSNDSVASISILLTRPAAGAHSCAAYSMQPVHTQRPAHSHSQTPQSVMSELSCSTIGAVKDFAQNGCKILESPIQISHWIVVMSTIHIPKHDLCLYCCW